jgi:hypothetical protein
MQQPLAFGSGSPIIYVTSDPSLNTIALTLTNDSGGPLSLVGGTPVAEESITPASPSTFYFNLSVAITAAELEGASVEGPGWNASFFQSVTGSWGVCPATDIQLDDQQSVTITITKLLVAGQPRPAQLNIDCYNFGTVPDGFTQIKMVIENPPVGPTNLSLDYEFTDGSTVYTTLDERSPIQNTLYFTISNPSPTNPIVPPDTPWGANPPVFNISFVYSDPPGYGALTTSTLGASINIEPVDQNSGKWTVEANTQSSDPYWILRPTTANHEILGTGADADVELSISSLVSTLPVGSAPDVTLMYIQYANIPGYNDGFITLQMAKVAGPAIITYYADPISVPYGQPSGDFTLYWTTQNAAAVTFDAPQIGTGFYGPNGSGPLPQAVSLNAEQLVRMTAYLNDPGNSAVSQSSVTVQRALQILALNRTSISIGINQLNVMMSASGKMFQFQTWGGNGALSVHQFAVVDLQTSAVTILDLNAAIDPAEGTDNGIQVVAASPDGSTIYVFVLTNASQFPSINDLILVTVNTATNQMNQVFKVSAYAGGLNSSLTTPDGSQIVLCNFALESNNPGGFQYLDTKTFQITASYGWTPTFMAPLAALFALSPDGTIGYMAGVGYFAILDIPKQTTLSTLSFQPGPLASYLLGSNPVITADYSRIYVVAACPKGANDCQEDTPSVLLELTIDPVTYAMTLSRQRTLGPQIYGSLLLSSDERTLYLGPCNNTIYFIDIASFNILNAPSGSSGYTAGVTLLGPQDESLYTSAGTDLTTIAGFSGATAAGPAQSRVARHFVIHHPQRS